MSLILDALKRAERERYSGKSPMLTELPSGLPRERARPGLRVVAVLAVLLAAAIALFALRKPHAPPAPADTPVTAAAAPAAMEPESPAAPPPYRPAPAPVPGTESVTSLDQLTSEPMDAEALLVPAPVPAPPSPAAVAPRARPKPAPKPVVEPPAEAAPAATASAAAPEPEPEITPPAPAAEPAQPAIPQALTQTVPMRRFREMTPEFRADFPPLTVDVHVFERTPTQRFVIVNGRRYREGEAMVEGPLVVEIVRDGMVLDWHGERFLYALTR